MPTARMHWPRGTCSFSFTSGFNIVLSTSSSICKWSSCDWCDLCYVRSVPCLSYRSVTSKHSWAFYSIWIIIIINHNVILPIFCCALICYWIIIIYYWITVYNNPLPDYNNPIIIYCYYNSWIDINLSCGYIFLWGGGRHLSQWVKIK